MKQRYMYHRLSVLSLLTLMMLLLGSLTPVVLAQQTDETTDRTVSPEATEEAADTLTDTQPITVETPVATVTPTPAETPEPTVPVEPTPAVDREALLHQVALETFATARPEADATIGLTKIIEPWALLNIRVQATEAGGETPNWETHLVLALWDETTWQVALEESPDFSTWLAEVPEALIPAEARPFLQSGAAAAAGQPDLALPFPLGRTWKFIHGPNGGTGRDGVDFGPFRLYEPTDFDPPGSLARDVTAAADGIVIDRDQHLLILRHADGWETGYFALAAASNSHPLGAHIQRGERVGLASDEVDSEAGVHVHFWVRRWGVTQNIEGFKLSGWKIFNDNSYEAGSRFGTMISDHKTERIDCPTVERYWLDPQLCHITHLPVVKSKVLPYPKTLYLKPGQIGVTTIEATDVYDLFSVSLVLYYDSFIDLFNDLSVVDADPSLPGIQVEPGSIFNEADDFIVTKNEVDTDFGIIYFQARFPHGVSFTGSGSLIKIAWRGEGSGTSSISLHEVNLIDPYGFPLSVAFKDGKVIVQDIPHLHAIQGHATLQGHTDHSGIVVTANETEIQTGLDGRFQIEAALPMSLTLIAPGHLSALADGAAFDITDDETPIDLGTITLLGGDVTGDDQIDIFDLAMIGSRYGSDDPLTDLNGDGVVDIFDLSMSAANYNQQGPITVWR